MTVQVSELDGVLRPIGQAVGLPNAAYTDADFAAAESKAVFQDGWAAIGFGKDVPGPGDATPIDFLGMPLLLLRDRKGAVRVFQNVCRHRGMILIDKPTRIKGVIRCPYHAWCYGMDGALRTTPDVGGAGINDHEDIDKDGLGLIEVRSTVWMDVVFVNMSGTAPDFAVANAPLAARWREFDHPIYHGGPESSFSLELKANWKLAVENYCESYHLPAVHPGLNSYSRLEDHYHLEEPGHFSGQGTLVYNPSPDASGRSFANFPGLSSKWDKAAEYASLYPNVLLGVHRDHTFAILLIPTGTDRVVERVELYYADPAMTEAPYDDLRRRNAEMWRAVFLEDVFVVEGMQRGRAAPGFDGGHFSPVMDGPTHLFHRWVAARMGGIESTPTDVPEGIERVA
ncbi:aromatic ring-hydroxylating dioxygenase subunit alpha [Rhodospirillaceae bacterium KN72]|uniref:Aromatic ring-hydroxylating dioxygenase subunit alpha n=1 Tax=Pacificispira spongiicola TaxID=2729598 RepID=A0A7Y0DWY5_9PROT|nr:aromatic ring-hydroxylating dioxygenase subunit alpha [Pacificispira spongiicola]NMM43120.1 aromatic ring-hydroxylating dioxygenase subunit alpha [Pacificispira spongiicola]